MSKIPTEVPRAADAIVEATTKRMLAVLLDGKTTERVARYFDPRSDFAGSLFETYEPTDPNRIEPADLVAITTLSVTVSPAGLRQLQTRLDEVNRHLAMCADPQQHLADADDDLLVAMYQALGVLLSVKDIGATTSSKILARKRPHLIPIYDSLIGYAYGSRSKTGTTREDGIPTWHWWSTYQTCLQDEGVNSAINKVRTAAGATSPDALEVSDLRILDVATWMGIKNGFDPDSPQST